MALGLMNTPLKSLSEVASLTQRALAGAERAFEILDTPPPLVDGSEVLDARRCGLSFEDVRFDYGEGEVLRGLSFALEPGETVALAASSEVLRRVWIWSPTRSVLRSAPWPTSLPSRHAL